MVHTAPVHEPGKDAPKILAGRHDTEKATRSSSNGPPDADQARAAADLERAYRRAMARVDQQKATAQRWIRRQAGRMSCQVEVGEPARAFLATRVAAGDAADRLDLLDAKRFDGALKTRLAARRADRPPAPAPAAPPSPVERGPAVDFGARQALPARRDPPQRRRPPTGDARDARRSRGSRVQLARLDARGNPARCSRPGTTGNAGPPRSKAGARLGTARAAARRSAADASFGDELTTSAVQFAARTP